MKKNGFATIIAVMVCIVILAVFSGCLTASFENHYVEDMNSLKLPDDFFLKPEENPEIVCSEDILNDVHGLRCEYYEVLGHSSFNDDDFSKGQIEGALKEIAIKKGAIAVVYSKKFSGTELGSYLAPQKSYVYSSDYRGGIRYEVETYKTNYYMYDLYDYVAVFLIKIPKDYRYIYRPGVLVVPLSDAQRKTLKRNTGAVVDVVYRDTPAFNANIIEQDIIVKVNEQDILSAADFTSYMNNVKAGDKLNIVLFRDGQEITVSLVSN